MAVDAARQGRTGSRRVVVRVMACLAIAAVLVLMLVAVSPRPAGLPAIRSVYAALSLDLAERFRTGEPAPETRIALGPFGRDVRLSGEIAEGAAVRLKALLADHPQVGRIHLTSDGGLVDEARAIGELVAARGLVTYVPDYCVSACTLIFVRGRERLLVTDGRLGFHAPFEVGLFGQVIQADGAEERAAYVAAGIEPDFAAEAVGVASGDLWIPDAARLARARVITGVVDTDRFPDSTLDDDPTPAGAEAAIVRNVPLVSGFLRAPGALERIGAWYLEAYRSGRTEATTLDGLRRLAAETVAQALHRADDATTLAVGRYLLRAMRAAKDARDDTCSAIGEEGNLFLAEEILSRDARPAKADPAEARALIERVAAQGLAPPPGPSAGLISGPARRCSSLIHAYAQALSKPSALRALVAHGRQVHEASALP